MERADTSISEIVAFSAVAQVGSFTQAAEVLGITKSSVTKAIQRLETRLSARLFQRTTRAVRLTEDGEIYQAASQIALESLRTAEQAIATRRAEPVGRVRVDLPAAFGRLLIEPLAVLRKKYPKITLELAFSDRFSDPVAEGWDIVVRIGDLPADGGMTVRKLCDLRFGLYASPEYISQAGEISKVADLLERDAIVFRASSGRLRPWTVLDGGEVSEITPSPALVVSDGQALIEAAVSGYGIAQMLDRMVKPYVDAGKLQHVLSAADVNGLPVHALIPSGQKMTAKTRVVLNYLSDVLKEPLVE